MTNRKTGGLPGYILWDLARTLARLEIYAERRNGRNESQLGRMEARLERIEKKFTRLEYLTVGGGITLSAALIAVLVKLFTG